MTNQQNPQSLDALASGRTGSDPFITYFSERNPTADDVNYPIQKRWFNTLIENEWILTSFTSFNGRLQANWQSVSFTSTGVDTLTGNSGGPVGVDINNNINVVGDGTTIDVVGTPGTNTLTASTTEIVATSYDTDSGSAVPAAGILQVVGGTGITTSGATNVITITTTNVGDMRSLGVQATSGGGTNPVLPDGAGKIEVAGARVAAGTNPIRSVSTAANTLQIQAQTSQAIAATDATKVGVANFDSASFGVDANGFVTNKFPFTTGTFTPTITFAGGSTGLTFSDRFGYYTRIGSIVFYNISIVLTNKGSSTGQVRIENLPFVITNALSPPFMDSMPISFGVAVTLNVGFASAWGSSAPGTTYLSGIQGGTGLTSVALTDANFANNTNITVTGFYITSA